MVTGMRNAIAVLLAAAGIAGAQIRWETYQDESVTLLQKYLRIDTQNPPGQEARAAEFFHGLFDAAGIPNTIFTFAPGRANIVARWNGDGTQRPLILLNHMDTVRADANQWKTPPLSGEIADGELWGRGALDMKSLGLMQAMVMVILAREAIPLHRDIIFLGTADEEVGDAGSTWMIEHHAELFRDAEYLLTEGGSAVTTPSGRNLYRVGIGEKAPLWIRMTATGTDGHGSVPIPESAPNRLVRAAARVAEWQPSIRLLPAVAQYFERIAPLENERLADIEGALKDPEFVRSLPTMYPRYNVLLRSTVSLTGLEAGGQYNVIPAVAEARFDCRLLPGEDPQAFLEQLRRVVDDVHVQVEIAQQFGAANASPADNALFRQIETSVHEHDAKALVAAFLDQGFTESQMYRKLGIAAYGFHPVVASPDVLATKHGVNERVPLNPFRDALPVLFDIVRGISSK
jgi:acetylornithine deacetylase/succinyl-diaminopimelate desuccinylase-like protein